MTKDIGMFFLSGGATFTSEEADLGFEYSIERLSW